MLLHCIFLHGNMNEGSFRNFQEKLDGITEVGGIFEMLMSIHGQQVLKEATKTRLFVWLTTEKTVFLIGAPVLSGWMFQCRSAPWEHPHVGGRQNARPHRLWTGDVRARGAQSNKFRSV